MKNNAKVCAKTPRRTAHRQIAEESSTQRAILDLSKNWKQLDMIERGESLNALIAAGCSRRGLARDLGQSPTSIRRHITVANLSNAEREAVKAGKSAKRILALKAQEDRRKRIQERIAEDCKTGAISDQLADHIIEFCKVNRNNVSAQDPDMLTLFLNEVRNYLHRPYWEDGVVKKVKRSLPLTQRFRLTRPKPDGDEFITAHLARWLAIFLSSEATEPPILERALAKAKTRKNELNIQKSPLQVHRERVRRLAELSESPPRRKF